MIESQEQVIRIRRFIAGPAASGTLAGRILSFILALAIIVLVLVLIVPILVLALLAGLAFVLVGAVRSLFAKARADNGLLDGRRNVRVIKRD
ncbi:MAG: hypothetical protein WCK33_02500 [Phycisphaerae bacterium]|jgi:hypothetical protein